MSSSLKLSYDVFFPKLSKKAPVVVMHGLLGSKENWRTLAKLLSISNQREVFTLDARNHGESPHSRDFNYYVMADDVNNIVWNKGFRNVSLIGHSMGGRTAMIYALTKPQRVEKLVVVDMSPISMPLSSSIISHYMGIMEEVVHTLPVFKNIALARKHADVYMEKFIPELSMRQFLLTNLKYNGNRFCWKANIHAIKKSFDEILTFPFVPAAFEGDTLFVCGENSSYVKSTDHPKILKLFPSSRFIYIAQAGHWVHDDRPQDFLLEVSKFLDE